MPIVDMPLEKLKNYNGTNPRPDDFDEYWDEALQEMWAIDPCPVFIPRKSKSRAADFFDLYFTSTKGAKIHARFARPKNLSDKAPAILQFHGLSRSAGEWITMLSFVSQGFCVASLDCRGQGGKSEDVGAYINTYSSPFTRGLEGDPKSLLYRDLFLDTAMLARVVMQLDYVDEKRVGALGSSQGGALTVACAALVPEIKFAAPNCPYLSDYKRVWEMDLSKDAYEGLKYYFRNFDPTHERENEIFTKLGYIDIQHLAPRIKAKVVMTTGLMDTVCPPSTQFAMFNKIKSEKEVYIYPDYAHESYKDADDRIFEFLCEL